MTKIISFLNTKGGSGKSTTTVNVARGIQIKGFDVLIGDCDPQASARNWRDLSDEEERFPQVIGIDRENTVDAIKDASREYDFALIDGLAKDMRINTKALLVSDLVIIPLNPSLLDIWGFGDFLDVIKQRQAINNGNPQAAFLITRQQPNSRLSVKTRNTLESHFPVLTSVLAERAVYKDIFETGSTVYELASKRHQKARDEVEGITNEILQMIGNKVQSRGDIEYA